jgi:arginyl-tRNA synthetase
LTPADLSDAIVRILANLVASEKLPPAEIPAEVVIERPKNREHGDWATNVAMQLSARFGLKPRDFAELLGAELGTLEAVSKVDIAGPGFINITLSAAAAGELAKAIVEAGASYGT